MAKGKKGKKVKQEIEEEPERIIKANDPEFNFQFKYAKNFIKTSKYNVFTFIPLTLFEQFQRLANFYFLCLLVIQLIPITPLSPLTTAVPLLMVLSASAIKDGYDDYQRKRSDNQVNNRKAWVLRDGVKKEETWSKVVVGDIIYMENDAFVAADTLLLATSEPNGLCYIETSELDGETNLKCRQCLTETAEFSESDIGQFDGEINCEPPNNLLNKFEGNLIWNGNTYALDNDKILLRGCILRNTQWCYGIVIFAGRDTKLMMNSGKATFKRTSIDRLLNWLIIGIVIFLFGMCFLCGVASGIWENFKGYDFAEAFLPWDEHIPEGKADGAAFSAFLNFIGYIIVLQTVVPISLYVSVEIIRLAQSFLINWDEEMYYKKSDTYAKARTTTLNEELGQIEYIFSDKTGTLTQNIMTFNKCSIHAQCYGDVIDPDSGEILEVTEHTPSVDFSQNAYAEESFKFYDQNLLDKINSIEINDPQYEENFFRLLALCHTIMPEEKDDVLEYHAQSPDEEALVGAARNFGFVFKSRTPNSINIIAKGNLEEYELLHILDFNNVRKRMSVILRRNGKICIYCKGADSIIYERLADGQDVLKKETQEHLNKYACEGLRTLVLAYKNISDEYYEEWKQKHYEASISLENREENVEAVYEEIEKNMLLIGASAIEDKLQDGVPEAIANLAAAGIKIWVLTGDKQETAINIGYSCQLLTDEMEDSFIIQGETAAEVEQELKKYQDLLTDSDRIKNKIMTQDSDDGGFCEPLKDCDKEEEEQKEGFSLVINGSSLIWALNPKYEELFLSVASQCKAVICCRVTPLQKALVVDLVKRHKKAVTLSIGDGANDVSMIKTAHIGVGISGQEGMQAVLSSDYSIAQFRYLERLLLVHGRWSYYRMSKFLKYFFYKNFAFTLCNFWYAFFGGFSAQPIFDAMFMTVYNLFYTSQPVLALGIFEQDVSDGNSIKYPKLYEPGLKGTLFNKKVFIRSCAHGIITSLVLFILPFGVYYNGGLDPQGLNMSDYQTFGTIVATQLVFAVTLQMCLDTGYWTVFSHITIWGSIIFYFILQYFYNYVMGGEFVGTLNKSMGTATFWLSLQLTMAVIGMPVLAWRFYMADVRPSLSEQVRRRQLEEIKRESKRKPEFSQIRRRTTRRSQRTVRTGYAFAHQEGFGRLITSGKIMKPSSGVKNTLGPYSSGTYRALGTST